MKQTSDQIDIKRYLPHRTPMLMVDFIVTINDNHVETIFEIKNDSIFIENDFFAEAGLIENMAQTCSSIVAKGYLIDDNYEEIEGAGVVGFISAIKTVSIHVLPKVGQQICTKATLVSSFVADAYTLCTMNCQTFLGERLIAEGQINLFIQETNLKEKD